MKKNTLYLICCFFFIIFFAMLFAVLVCDGFSYDTLKMEGFNVPRRENNINIDTSITSTLAEDFCNTYKGSGKLMNEKCSQLTKTNCQTTECCIWSKDKCLAGDKKNGALFS